MTRVRARVRRLEVRSTVVVARMVHLPRVSLRYTRRCLSLRALDLIVTLTMILLAPSLAVVLIIPSPFALLHQVKNQQPQLPPPQLQLIQ